MDRCVHAEYSARPPRVPYAASKTLCTALNHTQALPFCLGRRAGSCGALISLALVQPDKRGLG